MSNESGGLLSIGPNRDGVDEVMHKRAQGSSRLRQSLFQIARVSTEANCKLRTVTSSFFFASNMSS